MNRQVTSSSWIVAFFMSVIGVGAIGTSLYFLIDTGLFILKAKQTPGQVVDLAKKRSKNGYTYAPIVEFTHDDQQYRFTSSIYSNVFTFRRGETVTVLFSPQDPNMAKIKSFGQLWFYTVFSAFFGFFFTLLGFSLTKAIYQVKWLKENGARVMAQVKEVVYQSRKKGHYLICEFRDQRTGKVFTFESGYSKAIDSDRFPVRSMIPVYVDPQNPESYFVEIDAA